MSHHYGLGRHFFYLSDDLKLKAMEWEFIAEPFGKKSRVIKDEVANRR